MCDVVRSAASAYGVVVDANGTATAHSLKIHVVEGPR